MAQISAALVAEHSTWQGACEAAGRLHSEGMSQQHLSIAAPIAASASTVMDAIEAYRRSAGYRISQRKHLSNKGAGTRQFLTR
jgi:hypothetical protein